MKMTTFSKQVAPALLHFVNNVVMQILVVIMTVVNAACGGAVGTNLQAGRSRLRLNPSCRTMALVSTQSLNRNEFQEYFLGVKAAGT
jgi:metal-dependent HD superfamily phosphatase/phosphodiesterase